MIYFSHVYKTYPGPVHALRNIDLHVKKGEFVFLRGHSGAGKTTLFKMICAFDRPTSGLVRINGYDVNQLTLNTLPAFRRKIGVVFQDFKLLKDRTIFDNIALPLRILGERETVIDRSVKEMLDHVGLRDKKDFLPDYLSGGEQQRVAIARAIVHRPGVLIADEPTGNLDIDLSMDIMRLFEKVNAQGTTVFIATHDYELIQQFGKRVVELKSGQILAPDSKNQKEVKP